MILKHLIKTTLLVFTVGLLFTSCDGDVISTVTFTFSHNFDGTEVTADDFNEFDFINANDDTLSISRLRYLVSDIRLYKSDGDSVVLDDYQLVDVTNSTGLTFGSTLELPQGTYSGISFIFGFDSIKNVEMAYSDLNGANWNWPAMLGGGYHFLQMEGNWKDEGVSMPYAYHTGTARVSSGVFEQNYFTAILDGVTLNKANATIDIEMNIAEWYKNPYTWDFSTFSVMLMPNYTAQKLIQVNGKSVFSLGEVSQTD